jgi:hypothetical protein
MKVTERSGLNITTSRGEWLASNSGRLYQSDCCPRFQLAVRLGGPQIVLALMVSGNTLRSEVRTSSSPHRLSYHDHLCQRRGMAVTA